MNSLKKIKEKLSKIPKIAYLVVTIFVLALVSVTLPSFARFEHRNPILLDTSWSGNIATSYRSGSGTLRDPYIISDGSELAYFAQMLETTNYAGVYFKLGNNIVLNKGTFSYDEVNGITYEEDGITYYVDAYGHALYTDAGRQNAAGKNVQIFPYLKNFAGTFDGDSYTIYGAYVTSENEEVGLFTNLTGDIENLYVDNAMVYGGSVTGGIASSSVSSDLESVSFRGYVVNSQEKKSLSKEISLNVNPVTLLENETSQNLNISASYTENALLGNVLNVYLTGNLSLTNPSSSMTINGENVLAGDFSIPLDSNLHYNLPITVTGEAGDSFTFTDVKIVIQAEYSSVGGIIGQADGVTLKNIINKSDVYGSLYAGGLLGSTIRSTSIADTYNLGTVKSDLTAAGLIGLIQGNNEDVQVLRSYNAGTVVASNAAGILGDVLNNTGGVLLSTTFDTSDTLYKIHHVTESTVNVSGSYLVNGSTVLEGSVNGNFAATSLSNLQSSSFLVSFWPYIDSEALKTAPNRVWVFESGELPILYTDDAKNPVAQIHVGTYTWENVGYVLDSILFDSSTAFSIEEISSIHPVKEFYYKIVSSNEPLRASEISSITDWVSYTPGEVIEIKEEGFYIVYVKVVDANNTVSYLNTDLLVVDLSSPQVEIQLNNTTWDTLNDGLEQIYISEETPFTIIANDEYSGIAEILYTIQPNPLNESELNSLEENAWLSYDELGTISSLGNNVIYAKVSDQANHITYVSSDTIVYDGYTQEFIGSGYNKNEGSSVAVTSNSMLHTRFTYQSTYSYYTGSTHNLIFSEILPLNTKITLIDHKKNKVYTYMITDDTLDYGYNTSCITEDCEKFATIPLSLFKEVGTGSSDKYFDENNYTGPIDEEFTVLVDFLQTENSLSSLNISMDLDSDDETKKISTLQAGSQSASIYENETATVQFSASEPSTIYYNSDSITNIDIYTGIVYPSLNDVIIWDSRFEEQKIGVQVWLSNMNGEVLGNEHLKTMTFTVDGVNYYPEDDGILYIPLTNENSTLTITTQESVSSLEIGEYALHIRGYATYDGKYASTYSDSERIVPVLVTEESMNFDYGLEVNTSDENRVLYKNNGNGTLAFDVLNTGVLTDPNIRISLYQKKEFTAYNQDYQIVDLQNYATSTLDLATSNTYYVTRAAKTYDGTEASINHYEVNLDLAKMNPGGYQFVFELYDGTRKIGSIDKKYIVR